MENSSIVKVNKLIKRFPVGKSEFTALNGVNLDIKHGEFLGLVGLFQFEQNSNQSRTCFVKRLIGRVGVRQRAIEASPRQCIGSELECITEVC